MLDDLGERAPGYAEIGGGREDGVAKGEYAAILVKADRFTIQASGTFWLSDTPEVLASSTWGNEGVHAVGRRWLCAWNPAPSRENIAGSSAFRLPPRPGGLCSRA
jgi:hypothetical protein